MYERNKNRTNLKSFEKDEKNRLAVRVSTFGSQDPYEVFAISISGTGLLLGSEATLPFQIKTLVEIEVDINQDNFMSGLGCLGKVVRLAKGHSKGLDKYIEMFDLSDQLNCVFGVNIIEISDIDIRRWIKYIDSSNQSQNYQDILSYKVG